MKKTDHYVMRGEIELVSGMRIGGSDDTLQIGGVDLTCIKDPATGRPYIPGSSIKGRMRSSLEKRLGKVRGRDPCGCAEPGCPVCRVFGPYQRAGHSLGPTRIIVRDAPLVGEFTLENKTESTSQRNTGAAFNPRTVERVAPGAKFALEIGIQVFDEDEQFRYKTLDGRETRGHEAIAAVAVDALTEVEDTGLGAGTNKGYGQVRLPAEFVFERPSRRRAVRFV